ncbi:OLC1v1025545C1 [Oldenlandia corymbosa var. corymbosa]|uniref:OLC1v1025545C1 n=1 Tax=Oldenlandia corymbosa var. corymbosa TaxID=529605 RepID=A0AAV1C839_OLDCO|nr:OLC1v1025545C1 [Oldenlandia corymbosa var. corymbosa]
MADDSTVAQYVQDKWGQVADDKSCLLDSYDVQFERTVGRSAVYNDTHQLGVRPTCEIPIIHVYVSRLAEIDDNRSQFHTSMVNIARMFDGLNKDMEACMRKFDSMVQHVSQVPMVEIAIESLCSDSVDVNGFQECVDLQRKYRESISSEEVDEEIDCRDRYDAEPQNHGDNSFTDCRIMGFQGQGRSTILKINVVKTSETKLSSIEDGLKDVDTSLNDHGHTQHSGPSHQISGSSPLEHEKQCCLNLAGVDFAITSKMKLSSIEADIASDFSNLSHQEQGQLIMFDSYETKDTSPTADEILKGLICNGLQHGAAAVSAYVPSQFSQQDKSRLHHWWLVKAKSTNSLVGTDSLCIDVESDENQEEKCIAWLDYGAAVEWKFELTDDRRILKPLAGQGKRRCTRAYAKHFRSTPKRIRAFHVEKIVIKKDADIKRKVNENKECNENNRLKNDKAELKVDKAMEEQQIQSQLKVGSVPCVDEYGELYGSEQPEPGVVPALYCRNPAYYEHIHQGGKIMNPQQARKFHGDENTHSIEPRPNFEKGMSTLAFTFGIREEIMVAVNHSRPGSAFNASVIDLNSHMIATMSGKTVDFCHGLLETLKKEVIRLQRRISVADAAQLMARTLAKNSANNEIGFGDAGSELEHAGVGNAAWWTKRAICRVASQARESCSFGSIYYVGPDGWKPIFEDIHVVDDAVPTSGMSYASKGV